jgi:hypothetical protein
LGTPTIEDYSVLEPVSRGEVILVRDAQRELDPRRRGDRHIIENGGRSLLGVPLLFGEQVGGGFFFGTPREHWYDESDVEVGTAIAAALVLAIQHQRLAEHQQRLGAVEAKAQKLERQVATLRTALDDRLGFDTIIGRAPKCVAAIDDARKVAATATTVLLTGESGTGKEDRLHRLRIFDNPRAQSLNYAGMVQPGRVSIVDLSDTDSPQIRNLVIAAQLLRGIQRHPTGWLEHAHKFAKPLIAPSREGML